MSDSNAQSISPHESYIEYHKISFGGKVMKKNFKIKMTSLFLAIIFVIALPISISAQTVDIPSPNSEVQPQSFTREYTTYLTSSTRQVMSDGNWFGEELVIVRFTSSEGPTSISVYALDSAGNKIGPRTISLGGAASFVLKNVSGSFEIYASSNAGKNGNVKLTVVLSTYA